MNQKTMRTGVDSLRGLAAADPDFAAFNAENPELAQASLSPAAEAELADLLQQLPETAQALQRIDAGGSPARFDAGISSVPLLLVAAFLLRTHLRIKVSKGKWELVVEHKPADSKLVSELLAKISQWLSRQ